MIEPRETKYDEEEGQVINYGGTTRPKYYYPEQVVRFEAGGKPKAIIKSIVEESGVAESDNNALAELWTELKHVRLEKVGDQNGCLDVIPSAKMSKSKNNVVDPVSIVSTYGADTSRWVVLSDSPPERDVEWTSAGADAAFKHLSRVHRIAVDISEGADTGNEDDALLKEMHKTIHDVTMGIESFGFNTSIARLYAFTNTLARAKASASARRQAMMTMAQLMAPMTPHLAEEIWNMLGGQGLVIDAAWPVADPSMLVDDTVTMPIQINGKRRAEISVAKDMPKEEVEKLALANDAVVKALGGNSPKKLIVVPGRIINVVI
jgi:leucyl-tRNA synthetase